MGGARYGVVDRALTPVDLQQGFKRASGRLQQPPAPSGGAPRTWPGPRARPRRSGMKCSTRVRWGVRASALVLGTGGLMIGLAGVAGATPSPTQVGNGITR